jgi:subtilase family serine protease
MRWYSPLPVSTPNRRSSSPSIAAFPTSVCRIANGPFPSVIGDPAFVGPFNAPLTVDAPGDDPYVTSAGGTTLPTTLVLKHGNIAIPTVTLFNVPGNFAGRNVPDISLNADPETGYILFSTVDGGFNDFFGGTSFVAPQLNGIFSLIGQANGTRLGTINASALVKVFR